MPRYLSHHFNFSGHRRRLLTACLSFSLLKFGDSHAQTEHSKNHRLIVPFEPGGITDNLGRAVANGLKQLGSRTWVVENIPGAGGAIGAMRAAQSSSPATNLVHINAGTFRSYGNRFNPSVDFDPLTELQAVAVIGEMPLMCLCTPNNSAKHLKQYLQQLQTLNQTFVFGAVGLRNTSHMLAAQAAHKFQLEALIVPYKGSAPTMRALLSQEIPIAFIDPITAMPLLRAGRVKCLGISSTSNYPDLNIYPTFKEQGLAGDMTLWAGFFTSAKINRIDLMSLSAEMKRLTQSNLLDEVMQLGFIQRLSLFDDRAQQYVVQDVHQFQQKFQALQSKVI